MLRLDRAERERLEKELLAPSATRAEATRGRQREEEPDEFRTAFDRDRGRVVHSKAFRRLKHKTQVFLNPDGDHFVTRMTHTINVTHVGRAMSRALGLNEDLTEAICLAHDVGHSPFGHTGEEALTPLLDQQWLHSAHGVRVLNEIEQLNLTHEVLDGVRAHSWRIEDGPETPEGWICRYADRIAYLSHDVEDALRADVIEYHDLPTRVLTTFGATAREWISAMVTSVIETSHNTGQVAIDPDHLEVMNHLREFMFERVYLRPESEDQKNRAITIIQDLVGYFAEHPAEVPDSSTVAGAEPLQRAVDFVAGMTDRYALHTHDRLFRPRLFD